MTDDRLTSRIRGALFASGLIIAAMAALSAYAWAVLPADARIAVHWNIAGVADRFAGKWEGLVLLPAIALAVTAVFAALPVLEPRRRHLWQSSKAYSRIWLASLGLLGFLHAVVVLGALGRGFDTLTMVGIGLGILLMVTGNFLAKLHSNFFIGIRTPWTLSSERVWEKTHRLGGRLFMLSGLVLLLAALFGTGRAVVPIVIAAIAVVVFVVVAYSFLLWRQEQREGNGAR
ncbi:MAG: DUF1648 domain-containing protein [Alphaproteobacteria bacterium]|nr:MAG: DUF1648 domain-containing protein [Alphaproteobacteria bacterium]